MAQRAALWCTSNQTREASLPLCTRQERRRRSNEITLSVRRYRYHRTLNRPYNTHKPTGKEPHASLSKPGTSRHTLRVPLTSKRPPPIFAWSRITAKTAKSECYVTTIQQQRHHWPKRYTSRIHSLYIREPIPHKKKKLDTKIGRRGSMYRRNYTQDLCQQKNTGKRSICFITTIILLLSVLFLQRGVGRLRYYLLPFWFCKIIKRKRGELEHVYR